MLSVREGEVIVTMLHFSDVVHVDGRMLGALDEYVGAWGLRGLRCTDVLADQLPSTKPFCGIASLALAALTCLLLGPRAAMETRIALQTSVHAFDVRISFPFTLPPFRRLPASMSPLPGRGKETAFQAWFKNQPYL